MMEVTPMMMKKLRIGVVLCFLALPISAFAIDLRDYTNPNTSYQAAYLSGRFNFLDKGDNRLSETCDPEVEECQGGQASYNGTALANYGIHASTLPLSWMFQIDGTFDLERSAEEGADSQQGHEIFARANIDKYYQDTKFLGYGSADAAYRKLMGADDADDPYAKVGIGVGYGRIIDATVLAKAIRSVEDLRKYGVMTQELSDEAYLRFAEIIDREREFQSQHGAIEYEQYWFDAIEEVLRAEGVLAEDTLGAMGVIRVREILLNEPFSVRKHGWIARAGVGFVLSNFDGSDSDPSLDLAVEYAYPYTYRLQLLERATYSTILGNDVVHQITNALSVTYEVSNRIDWENRWTVGLTLPTESDAENIISNNLSTTFRYYLSNKLNADATLSLNHLDDGIDDNGNDDLETAFFAGITYSDQVTKTRAQRAGGPHTPDMCPGCFFLHSNVPSQTYADMPRGGTAMMRRIVWGVFGILCLWGPAICADSQSHDFHRTEIQSATVSVDTVTVKHVTFAENKRFFGKRLLHVTVTVSNAGPVDKDVVVFLAGHDQDWQQVIFVAGLKPPHAAVPKNGSMQLERTYYIDKHEFSKVEHVTIRLIVRRPPTLE
jgi:hypothetical protein